MDHQKQFGENLRKLREKRGMLQRDLADKLNVGLASVSNYEVGKRFPPINTLIDIANFFNVTIDELVYGPDEEDPNEVIEQHEEFLKDLKDGVPYEEILKKYDFDEIFEGMPFENKKRVLEQIEFEYYKLEKN